jgi:O-antigen/teichoic acid export membrane protein
MLWNGWLLSLSPVISSIFGCVFIGTWQAYRQLLASAMPQFGVSVLVAIMARFDWILLGIWVSSTALAEYSVAYKLHEVAAFPLLVIAPILIPRFTKIVNTGTNKKDGAIEKYLPLLRFEMIIASFSALILNLLWVPMLGLITFGKYGIDNSWIFFILSISLPFIYCNNFLWTFHFASGRLRKIFFVFAASFLITIGGDIVLIPIYQGKGAAIACLLGLALQCFMFWRMALQNGFNVPLTHIVASPIAALLSGLLANFIAKDFYFVLPLAVISFIGFILLFRQWQDTDRQYLRRTYWL